MVSEGEFPCSQEQVIGPYPELHESSPHPHTITFKIHFNIVQPMSRFLIWSLPIRFSG